MSFLMDFNGVTLPIKILDVGGRGPYTQEVTRRIIPGRDSSYFIKRRLPDRSLPVRFIISDATSLNELRDKVDDLNQLLSVPEPSPIVFSDEPNRTYTGILEDEPDWEEIMYYGMGTLPFIRSPYKYGFEENVTLGDYPIRNEGTAEANPIITAVFSGAANEYKIEHESGKYVRVIYNFVANDRLVIDLSKRKVTINNKLQMVAYDWRSQPFYLLPGTNKLTVTPAGKATTTIKFSPRWL